MVYGLGKSVFDWRAHLRTGADFDGKDEIDAGKDYGSAGSDRGVLKCLWMV